MLELAKLCQGACPAPAPATNHTCGELFVFCPKPKGRVQIPGWSHKPGTIQINRDS